MQACRKDTFSSAASHIGKPDKAEVLDVAYWRKLSAGMDWKMALQQKLDDKTNNFFQTHYLRGRPLGSDKFISKLETALGRRLSPLSGGRPKKKETKPKTR